MGLSIDITKEIKILGSLILKFKKKLMLSFIFAFFIINPILIKYYKTLSPFFDELKKINSWLLLIFILFLFLTILFIFFLIIQLIQTKIEKKIRNKKIKNHIKKLWPTLRSDFLIVLSLFNQKEPVELKRHINSVRFLEENNFIECIAIIDIDFGLYELHYIAKPFVNKFNQSKVNSS